MTQVFLLSAVGIIAAILAVWFLSFALSLFAAVVIDECLHKRGRLETDMIYTLLINAPYPIANLVVLFRCLWILYLSRKAISHEHHHP